MAIFRGIGGAGDSTTDATVTAVTEQATNAANSATNAASSASSASSSASAASTSETNAASSASSASTSAANAATSASNAASSASFASTSATNAAASETAAGASETAAAASESAAATSASNAATSVSSASSSASTATTKASEASDSASAASTSASNAATSASNAAASESAASTSATNAATSETNAATSATNAATSATNAASSASAASGSASAASTSATNAAASETAAAASETAAGVSETNAATSATNAASSASAAATSETNAATSATNAATSESNASTSESNASTSATNAASSATNASSSATNAASSATNAASSASNAATSASNASTSATSAATSATNAASSATSAASSATSAATSASNALDYVTTAGTYVQLSGINQAAAETAATNAASSATSAAASADAALSALDNFDDRYLGQKTSDPSLDNDGDALVAGALYFNTSDNTMKVYEGSTWVAAYASLSGALLATNNLSDLNNVSTAITNLGLAASATTDTTNASNISSGTLNADRLADSGVTAGSYGSGSAVPNITVDAKGRVTDVTTSSLVIPTYSISTSTTAGIIKLEDDTVQSTAANTVTSTASRTYGIQKNSSDQAVVNVPWTDTVYSLPEATSTVRGGIELFSDTDQSVAANSVTATASRTYGLQLNSAGQGVINVPWTDTTYGTATTTTLGLIKLGSDTDQTVAANTVTATASRTYAVQLNSSDQAVVNVPWTDTTYTLPAATSTVRGGIELGSDTQQTVAANAVTATASRTYALQVNSAGQGVVNVPWVDTNTVYTHPTHPGDDIDLDTGPLTGATVISDLDFNVTTDTLGHVTDANATYSTRNLTASDVGAAPSSHDHTSFSNMSFIRFGANAAILGNAGYYVNVTQSDSNSTYGGFRLSSPQGIRGYLYHGTTDFGLLDSDGQWAVRTQAGTNPLELRCDNNPEFYVYTTYTDSPGSSRAPIFYDSGNTSYYVDPASTGTSANFAGTAVAATFNATSATNGGFQGIDADTATTPSFTWTSDLDTGVWHAGTNQIGFTTGGTNRLTISTTAASSSLTIDAPTFNATSTTNGGFQGIDADTAASPSFTWTADLNTGMYRYSTDVVGLSAGGNDEFRVYSSYTYSPGSSRAPIFYDSANTSYYVQPTNLTNLWRLKLRGVEVAAASGAIHENAQAITSNYTMASTVNGMSAGPITINSGVTVTISSGANWAVV